MTEAAGEHTRILVSGLDRKLWFVVKFVINLPVYFSIRCFKNQICTVTGPTVIDFQGQQSSVKDRCVYSLVSDSSSGFEVLANFQERRRRDVSFLDSVSLRPAGSEVYFHLEQGGRIKVIP